jgi:hypothetical protein
LEGGLEGDAVGHHLTTGRRAAEQRDERHEHSQ